MTKYAVYSQSDKIFKIKFNGIYKMSLRHGPNWTLDDLFLCESGSYKLDV